MITETANLSQRPDWHWQNFYQNFGLTKSPLNVASIFDQDKQVAISQRSVSLFYLLFPHKRFPPDDY